MKKIAGLMLSLVLAVSLAACQNTPAAKEERKEAKDDASIVVYFSATGNTKKIAEDIAQLTGANLFEIEPATPYTKADLAYDNDDSRVAKERTMDDRKVELKTVDVPDWDDYDTVYVGYPIWWDEAGYPGASFVKGKDFSDKVVYPFCTSSSSKVGDSATKLEDLTKTGVWFEGQRFAADASIEDVDTWLNEIGAE